MRGRALLAMAAAPLAEVEAKNCDVLVYGSTPGGVAAAVEAARRGLRTVLECPKQHLGWRRAGCRRRMQCARRFSAASWQSRDETAFEDGLDDVGKGVMHNTVAESGGGNETRLGIDDAERAIGAGPVGVSGEPAAAPATFSERRTAILDAPATAAQPA